MYRSPSPFRRLAAPLFAVLCFLAVSLAARAQNVSLLTVQSFGPAPDGADPAAAMIQASDGNFYGTTNGGGANGTGTIYRYNPFTNDYAVIYNFSALAVSLNTNADGAGPRAELLQAQDGNFYGTASYGGTSNNGTIFRLTPGGVFTTLHSFTGTDGSGPYAGLLQTADGTFYGTTSVGDSKALGGSVFSLTPAGTFAVLHRFTGATDGGGSHAPLLLGQDGNLYGTTTGGGASGYGTVFRITTTGTLTTIHSFDNTNGASPSGKLVQGGAGNFFGTTESGGANSNGTIFRLTPTGDFTLLYEFAGGQPAATDGANPFSGLLRGPDGQLFGTTYAGGGPDQHGTIFSVTNEGALTTLYRFTGGDDGSNPTAALTLDQRGDFYGVTGTNGGGGGGTIFALNVHGILAFGTDAATVSENAGSVTLTVNRTGGSRGAIGVSYTTAGATALAGTDYAGTAGTLSWPDGDLSPRTITVPLIDRGIFDNSTRAFTVTLSLPTGGAVLQSPAVETITIAANDRVPAIPAVNLESPLNGATIFAGAPLTFAANVADPDNVLAAVTFTLNGVPVGSVGAAGPYVFSGTAPAAAGIYTVAAIATDNFGRQSQSTALFNVRLPAATGDPAPTAAILTDLNHRAIGVGQAIPIAAFARTSSGDPLQRVDFYAGGVRIASFDGSGAPIPATAVLTTRPPTRRDAPAPLPANSVFQTVYQVPAAGKLVNILVVAFTKLGVATASDPVTLRAIETSVGLSPTVSLDGLANGATVQAGTPITLGANILLPAAKALHPRAAAVQLADLAFYLNAALLQHGFGNDPSRPSFTFTPPSAGDYVVEAIATDTDGLSGVAMPIRVHAVNAPPVVTVAVAGDGRAQFGSENGKVAIRRTGGTSAALTVSYRTKGAAKSGVDFKTLSGTLVIPAGAAQAKLKLKPLRNPANTGTLKSKIVLLPSGDGSYQLGNPTVAKVKVIGGE